MDNINNKNASNKNQEAEEEIKEIYTIETMDKDKAKIEKSEKKDNALLKTIDNKSLLDDVKLKKETAIPESQEPLNKTETQEFLKDNINEIENQEIYKKPIFSELSDKNNMKTPSIDSNDNKNEQDGLSENIIQDEYSAIKDSQSGFRKFFPFILGFVAVAIIGIIAVVLIYVFAKNKDTDVVDNVSVNQGISDNTNSKTKLEQTTEEKINPDKPLFPVDQTLIVDADINMTRADFLGQLRDIINQSYNLSGTGDIIRIYLINNNKKITLDNLLFLLSITDIYTTDKFNTDNYDLFYNDSSDGLRFGLVTEIIDNSNIKDYFKDIENNIIGLNNQIFSEYTKSTLPKSVTNGFNDSSYQGVDIRYINFKDESMSIDYAIKDNIFIIAGSMKTMHETIDRINLIENIFNNAR